MESQCSSDLFVRLVLLINNLEPWNYSYVQIHANILMRLVHDLIFLKSADAYNLNSGL